MQVPDRQIVIEAPDRSLRAPGPDGVQPPPAALDIASRLPVLMPAVQHGFTPDLVQVVWPGPEAGLAHQVVRTVLRMGDEAQGLISVLLHRPFRARLQADPRFRSPCTRTESRLDSLWPIPCSMANPGSTQAPGQIPCPMANPMFSEPRLASGSRADHKVQDRPQAFARGFQTDHMLSAPGVVAGSMHQVRSQAPGQITDSRADPRRQGRS